MRHHAPAIVVLLCLLPCAARAQVAPVVPSTATPVAGAGAASAMVQPSLGTLQRVLGTLEVEKWKLPRPAREEARRNIDSIRQDMSATLPPLLTAADAAPGSVPAQFAMLRNVDALYDVALRLSATALLAAPGAQASSLDQALGEMLQARRAIGDRAMADATAQERQVAELQGRMRASPVTVPVCPTATAAPVDAKGKSKRTKPRPKPAPPVTPQQGK